MRKKQKKVIWTVIGIVLAIALVLGLNANYNFIKLGKLSIRSPPSNQLIGVSPTQEKLDFCSEVNQCISYLKSQGMPDSYLSDKIITCNGGCIISKK